MSPKVDPYGQAAKGENIIENYPRQTHTGKLPRVRIFDKVTQGRPM